MQSVVDLFKQSLDPAAATTIILMFAIGALLLYVRGGRWGRRWITAVAIGYWLIATPVCASLVEWPLTRGLLPIRDASDARGARTIVLLSGGTITVSRGQRSLTMLAEDSASRTLEAARLYFLLGRPTVVSSGGTPVPTVQTKSEGAVMVEGLLALGVSSGDIVLEDASKTTYEEAVFVGPILAARRTEPFLLVTSAVHMRRSLAVFRAQGLRPIAAVSLPRSETASHWRARFIECVPSRRALFRSVAALHEYAGLFYYLVNGRLTPAPVRPEPSRG